MRRFAAVVLILLLGCSSGDGPGTAGPSQEATPAVRVSPDGAERRPLTKPKRAVVDNLAAGRYRRLVRRAVADLKAIGLWRRLTKELFVVEVSARPGRSHVPDDAHLADAYRKIDIRARHAVLCDITFYPTAMDDDLARWRSYHSRGLIAEVPPSPRQLWASILAHELSHCFQTHNREPQAQRWERRALEALRGAGIG